MSLRTLKASKNKSTDRLLRSILPGDFKMVKDPNSNGYKFINLLYGREVDEARRRIESVYDNSFLSTFDTSTDYSLYEVNLSGLSSSGYLNVVNSGTPIKIVDEDEFFNGYPTRFYAMPTGDFFDVTAGTFSGIMGIEYFRDGLYCSGYFLLSERTSGVIWEIPISNTSVIDVASKSGDYPGVMTQSYDVTGKDEILIPEDSGTLSGRYPETRQIWISGVPYTINHYEPDFKYRIDVNDNVVAYNYYDEMFYYDEEGNKRYHRTMLNNPYGSGNYTTSYLPLSHTPISGTLHLYDIDILDASGDATEIPATGKAVYYFQSPYWNIEPTGHFDPTYMGYDSTVPTGRGFGLIEGSGATAVKTTSWDYLKYGHGIEDGTFTYSEGTGSITNAIKIVNPQSRYIVEYDWYNYNKIYSISSSDSNGYVRLASTNPVYAVDNLSGNLEKVNFEFTKNPNYRTSAGNEASKIITFNGLEVRPGSSISRIETTLPLLRTGSATEKTMTQVGKLYAGYSSDFVPIVETNKIYQARIYFSSTTTTETNLVNSSGITQTCSAGNKSDPIYFGSYYGKRLVRNDGQLYYQANDTYFNRNTFYHFYFRSSESVTLLNMEDSILSHKFIFSILSSRNIHIDADNYSYTSSEQVPWNTKQELIFVYKPDDVSSSVPIFDVYNKIQGEHKFSKLRMNNVPGTPFITMDKYTRFPENSTIDMGFVKIWYEVY